MRLRYVLLWALGLYAFTLTQAASATPPNNRCALPSGLRDEISKQYPGTRLVSVEEMDEYQRKLYRKDFGARCPGLVRVNFYGDKKPTWALLLIATAPPVRKPELIVAHQSGQVWDIRSLGAADGAVTVWRENSGRYVDVYGQKTISATRPVIVISDYGSFTILYSWTGKGVEQIWLSD